MVERASAGQARRGAGGLTLTLTLTPNPNANPNQVEAPTPEVVEELPVNRSGCARSEGMKKRPVVRI